MSWILSLYYQPTLKRYQYLAYLNKKRYWILPLLFILFISYPLYFYITTSIQKEDEQQKITQTEMQLTQQHHLLQSLTQFQNNALKQDKNMLNLNQQITKIIERQQLTIEEMQWYWGEEKSLFLHLQQNTHRILQGLSLLNQLESFKFQEIILSKQHHRLIQLNTTLMISP